MCMVTGQSRNLLTAMLKNDVSDVSGTMISSAPPPSAPRDLVPLAITSADSGVGRSPNSANGVRNLSGGGVCFAKGIKSLQL